MGFAWIVVRRGWFNTDMHTDRRQRLGRVDRIAPNLPLQRVGNPEESWLKQFFGLLSGQKQATPRAAFIDVGGVVVNQQRRYIS